MQHRTLFIFLAYVTMFLAIFLSLALFIGLYFFPHKTMQAIITVRDVTAIIGTFLLILFIIKKSMDYRHAHILQREERRIAQASRIKEEEAANVLRMEAYHKEQQAEKVKAEMYIQQKEFSWKQQEYAMNMEIARARFMLEQQQSMLLRVNASESVYAVQPNNELKQLVQGQVPTRVQATKSIPEQVAPLALPYAPTFARMKELITSENNLVLGYTSTRPIYGTLEDHLLSMLSTGRPKTGKSTGLLYFAAMFLKVGVLPVVLDPQGSLCEVEGILPYRNSMQSIHEFLPLLNKEFDEREELWRKGRILKPYSIVVIIDELLSVVAWEEENLERGDKSVLSLIKRVITQLRKLHVYVVVASQGFPATVLNTISRDNTSSRLVFPTTERFARMAGLSEKHIKTLLPQLDAVERGTAILDVSCEKEPYLVHIPFTTVDDVVQQIENGRIYHELIQTFESGTTIDSDPLMPVTEKTGISKKPSRDDIEEIILQEYKDGYTSIRAIERHSGISYNILRPIYNELKEQGMLTT